MMARVRHGASQPASSPADVKRIPGRNGWRMFSLHPFRFYREFEMKLPIAVLVFPLLMMAQTPPVVPGPAPNIPNPAPNTPGAPPPPSPDPNTPGSPSFPSPDPNKP